MGFRQQRLKLFQRQKGRCHWCGSRMLEPRKAMEWGETPQPPNLCTLDHIDYRLWPERGKHPWKLRKVAACWDCNQIRSRARMSTSPAESSP